MIFCYIRLERWHCYFRLSLAEATGRKDILTFTANSQAKLLDTYDVDVKNSCPGDFGTVDPVSVDILKMYQPALLDRLVPLYVVGDGNCFYRAASRALCGEENQHNLLRLKTALEIILNRKYYDTSMRTYKDLIEDNRIIVSNYKKLIKDTIQLGSYSEMIHMYALSAVLKMPIRSYYPPQMSPELSSDCYTRKVVGRNVRTKSDPPITVMWTQMIKPRNVRSFVPNHFVCLTEREVQPELITIDDSDTSVEREREREREIR